MYKNFSLMSGTFDSKNQEFLSQINYAVGNLDEFQVINRLSENAPEHDFLVSPTMFSVLQLGCSNKFTIKSSTEMPPALDSRYVGTILGWPLLVDSSGVVPENEIVVHPSLYEKILSFWRAQIS